MNINAYLNLLYKLVKSLSLIEKREICVKNRNKVVNSTNRYKKNILTTFFVCKINLENNRVLLIDDIGINFLLSYSIVIGRKCELFEFKIKPSNNTSSDISSNKYIDNMDLIYIASQELLDILSKDFEIIEKKKIKARELFNKKYSLEFTQPKMIQELKLYSTEMKNIDFEKIHIIDSTYCENFVPTCKREHFKLATSMNIPLIEMIDNNYIKRSIINIYDINGIEKIIKPFFKYEKKTVWDIDKTNHNVLYNDIFEGVCIDFDKENIINRIQNCASVNFEKDYICNQIQELGNIPISSRSGDILIPLWKAKDEQLFVEIKDKNEFKDISGVDFKLNSKFLEEVYISGDAGKKAYYKPRFLCKEFSNYIKNLKKSNRIVFKDIKELIILLIYNDDIIIDEILFNDLDSSDKIDEIYTITNKILHRAIMKSIEINKQPKKKVTLTDFDKLFSSVVVSSHSLIKGYNKTFDKGEIINKILKKVTLVYELLLFNDNKLDNSNIYYLLQVVLKMISFLKFIGNDSAILIENEFNEYFKDIKLDRCDNISLIDERAENIVRDVNIVNKMSKNCEVFIIEKEVLLFDIMSNNVNNITDKKHERYIKPNIYILKQIFKYSYKDIAKQISNLSIKDIKYEKCNLVIKNRKFPIKKNYYTLFKKYDDYKIVCSNDMFSVLVRR